MTEREAGGPVVVDLAELAQSDLDRTLAWSLQSEDLNVNLLVFGRGGRVEEHVNAEVDVLLVAIAGAGEVLVDGVRFPLAAGRAILVPKGARRATRCVSERFAYLTCHRRRRGLWPTTVPRNPRSEP